MTDNATDNATATSVVVVNDSGVPEEEAATAVAVHRTAEYDAAVDAAERSVVTAEEQLEAAHSAVSAAIAARDNYAEEG